MLRCCTHIQTYIQMYCIHYADAYRDNIIIDYLIQSIQLKQHFHMHTKRILSICNTHRCKSTQMHSQHNSTHPTDICCKVCSNGCTVPLQPMAHVCVIYHSNVIQLFSSNIYGHLYMYVDTKLWLTWVDL